MEEWYYKGVNQDVDGSKEQPVSCEHAEHTEQEPNGALEEPAAGIFGHAD